MKRYVLLDNDLIYDRTKLDKDKDWLILRILEKIDKGETDNLARTLKHQSDNLIDLAEVGDMVELDNKWEILKVLRFNKDSEIVCMVRTSSNTEEYALHDYRKKHITALWKRNGDVMRRYEVEVTKDVD